MAEKLQRNYEVDAIRERTACSAYAEPRFDLGGDRERALHHLLKRRVQSAYDSMHAEANRAFRRIPGGFYTSHPRLMMPVLERACTYCGELFGVDEFGTVYDVRLAGPSGAPGIRGLVTCAHARVPRRRLLAGGEWRDVLAALQPLIAAKPQRRSERWPQDIAATEDRPARKGTPRAAPAAGNASVAPCR